MKDANGDLLAYSHNILNGWKDYFYQVWIVHSIRDIKQIHIHTSEPLVPYPSSFKVEITIAKLKKYKSSGSDKILTELIEARGETLLSELHKLILIGIRKNCLTSGKGICLFQFTKRAKKLTIVIILGCYCYQLHTKFYQKSSP
jgi:hypothetical protein